MTVPCRVCADCINSAPLLAGQIVSLVYTFCIALVVIAHGQLPASALCTVCRLLESCAKWQYQPQQQYASPQRGHEVASCQVQPLTIPLPSHTTLCAARGHSKLQLAVHDIQTFRNVVLQQFDLQVQGCTAIVKRTCVAVMFWCFSA